MTSRRFERSGIVFLAAALCAACQTLPAIPLSTCGNGVIESAHGEDCDLVAGGPTFLCGASDAGAKACRFLWDPDHTCPPGFGAGGDGICHRPSGAFTQAPGSPFPATLTHARLADLDADGSPDLVATNAERDGLSVFWGDGTGRFTPRFDLSTGEEVAPPAVAPLVGDTSDDVVIPLARGLIVLEGDNARGVQPAVYSAIPASDPTADTYLFPVGLTANQSMPVTLGSQKGLRFDVRVVTVTPSGIVLGRSVLLEPRGNMGDLAGRPAIANLDPTADGPAASAEFAVGLVGHDTVHVLELIVDATEGTNVPATARQRQAVALPAPLIGSGISSPDLYLPQFIPDGVAPPRIFFTDVDRDGTLDLLALTTDPTPGATPDALPHVAVARGLGDGTFGPALPDAARTAALGADTEHHCPGLDGTISGLGSETLPRAIADFDGDGDPDYVLPTGIVLGSGRGAADARCAFSPGDYIDQAATGDFNRDGHLDAVMTVLDRPGLTIAFGDGHGGFNQLSVPAGKDLDRLRVGDFDGDFVDDVAFVLPVGLDAADMGGDEVAGAALHVVFGRTDARLDLPESQREMGTFEAVQSIEAYRDERLRADVIDDLMVVSIDAAGGEKSRAVASLVGTAQRLMLSPLTLVRASRFLDGALRVVAGRFDGKLGLLAIARAVLPPGAPPMAAPPTTETFLLPSEGGARLLPAKQDIDTIGVKGASGSTACAAGFGWESSMVQAVGLAPGASSESLLAIDDTVSEDTGFFSTLAGGGSDGVPDLLVMTRSGGAWRCAQAPLAPADTPPISWATADFDGDGHTDLAVTLSGYVFDGPLPPFLGQVMVYWGRSGGDLPFDLSHPTEIDPSSVLPPGPVSDFELPVAGAVAAAQLAGDDRPELLVEFGNVGMAGFQFGTDRTVTPLPTLPYAASEFAGAPIAADVNRDGLVDLIVRETDRVRVLLGVDALDAARAGALP